jgi:hypothetical protein
MLLEKIQKLAAIKSHPCLSISLNTHRTHPDNQQDAILLKNLCKEAEQRLLSEFEKREVLPILEQLEQVQKEINIDYLLDSLHIFISINAIEVIRTTWPTHDRLHIADTFDLRHLIKAYNRSEEYLILLVSQSGVQLYDALNNSIQTEIRNQDFPFEESTHYHTDPVKLSDSKRTDDMVREYLNKVDKAVVKIYNETGLHCVVICTQDNYDRLMQVADRPQIYHGHVNINYNDTAPHTLALSSWNLVKTLQEKRREAAIADIQQAVSQGKVLTDIREIYSAAREGRGELLVTHQDYIQPVRMIGDSFDLIDIATEANDDDDIIGDIAWEVISKKGRAVFVDGNGLGDKAKIALKVRY